jgi:hypothetical protein
MGTGLATLVALIGRQAHYRTDNGLIFSVNITDVKVAYGKTRVQISPSLGDVRSSTWVELTSVVLLPDS